MSLVTSLSLISSLPFLHLKLSFCQVANTVNSISNNNFLINFLPSFPTRKGTTGNNPERRPGPYHRWLSMQLGFPWEATVTYCIVLSKVRIFRKMSPTVMYEMAWRSTSMILISNSALTLHFPSYDSLVIHFSSAFSCHLLRSWTC